MVSYGYRFGGTIRCITLNCRRLVSPDLLGCKWHAKHPFAGLNTQDRIKLSCIIPTSNIVLKLDQLKLKYAKALSFF